MARAARAPCAWTEPTELARGSDRAASSSVETHNNTLAAAERRRIGKRCMTRAVTNV